MSLLRVLISLLISLLIPFLFLFMILLLLIPRPALNNPQWLVIIFAITVIVTIVTIAIEMILLNYLIGIRVDQQLRYVIVVIVIAIVIRRSFECSYLPTITITTTN